MFKMKKKIVLKDLLNDLERSEEIKKRVMDQMSKTRDQPSYNLDQYLMSSSSISFNPSNSFMPFRTG